MSPDESLVFILADNGFDVWLANVRGTNFSFRHKSLSPNDPEFWNWSWDELVAYDLPAAFHYVYDQIGQKLHYVGHSLGTLMALGAFSRHEVLSMVRSAALLSPIAYLGQMTSPFGIAIADIFIAEALYWLGLKEFTPGGSVSTLLVDVCSSIDCSNLEIVVTVTTGVEPVIREGTIAMYDYGNEEDNHEHYGQATPPNYNMTTIPTHLPLFLSYGGRDLLSDVNDVQKLIASLSDHDPDKLVVQYIEDYSHLDFVYGVNANQVVYKPLMAFFKLN